jgi:ppGpp synthetase/RelA/SpoT-type nucleotidyltranferase
MSDIVAAHQIQSLGKRIRDGQSDPADLAMLDAYRSTFDAPLLDNSAVVTSALRACGIPHLLCGRLKRTKSIIRKLRRETNNAMDLSRMADVAGFRVIVGDTNHQEQALQVIASATPQVRAHYDYRSRTRGYRAVHFNIGTPARRVEIQLRTCAQHLWADQSESLGEQVKEGLVSDDQKEYLERLWTYCRAIDDGKTESAEQRVDFAASYGRLHTRFLQLMQSAEIQAHIKSFVVVYDSLTNSLIRVAAFDANQREEALAEFRYQSSTLDDTRFDTLILNSGTQAGLTVTHPRYFPEGPEC